MAQFVSPNLWTLSGGVTHIHYSTEPIIFGGNTSVFRKVQVQLGRSVAKIFEAWKFRTSGRLSAFLSNVLWILDWLLSQLLPRVNLVPQGAITSAPVSTIAITTHHDGPFTPPFPFGQGQQGFYHVIDLTGTASSTKSA
jgi:hypothetical protein